MQSFYIAIGFTTYSNIIILTLCNSALAEPCASFSLSMPPVDESPRYPSLMPHYQGCFNMTNPRMSAVYVKSLRGDVKYVNAVNILTFAFSETNFFDDTVRS